MQKQHFGGIRTLAFGAFSLAARNLCFSKRAELNVTKLTDVRRFNSAAPSIVMSPVDFC
jgi:hypothetical protein